MRRVSLLLSVVALVLFGLVARGTITPIQAQDSTPAPGGFEFAPGIVAYPLALAEGATQPSLYRLTFAPDATLVGGTDDPSISLILVETGSLTATIEAPVALTRGGDASATELVEAGTAFTADAGDYFVVPPFIDGEYRNGGQEEVAIVVAAILPDAMAPVATGTPAA